MKTIKFLSMMLVMLAMSVCMAGCSNDDDDSEFVGDSASIVGSWVQTNEYGTLITLYFKADKTGVINYTYSDMSGDSNENFEYDYIETVWRKSRWTVPYTGHLRYNSRPVGHSSP